MVPDSSIKKFRGQTRKRTTYPWRRGMSWDLRTGYARRTPPSEHGFEIWITSIPPKRFANRKIKDSRAEFRWKRKLKNIRVSYVDSVSFWRDPYQPGIHSDLGY